MQEMFWDIWWFAGISAGILAITIIAFTLFAFVTSFFRWFNKSKHTTNTSANE